MRLLTRVEQLAKVTYESRQVKCVRYNVGTIGGEISGERTCKRRSAKHLEFLPSLLEGRRSIQLSYGRNSYVDSKSFIAKKSMILARLPSADRADAPCNCATCSSLATHLILLKLQSRLDSRFVRNLGATWSNWNGRNGETDGRNDDPPKRVVVLTRFDKASDFEFWHRF